MQIAEVKISNLLNFLPISDLKNSEGIKFKTGIDGGINILIGPNGTGKTSFLEIINQVFKVGLIKDYVYSKTNFLNKKKEVITENKMYLHNLDKNFFGQNKKSEVIVSVVLSENDYDNLAFVCKYHNILNGIISKYSKLRIKFDDMSLESLYKYPKLDLHFYLDLKKKCINLNSRKLDIVQKYILKYINNHELIQICMNIYNDFEKNVDDRFFYPLKNTFAILGSYRNFLDIGKNDINFMHISPKRRSNYISGQNTKTYYSMSIGYHLCVMKLRDILGEVQKDCIKFNNNDFSNLYEDIYREKLRESDFYKNLNRYINKYLGMDLFVEYKKDNFVFSLKMIDNNLYNDKISYERVYYFNQLSSGDQSFLLIILTVFGYDMDGGLMIIDEPELHLHPQMQKRFIDFTSEINQKFALQIIFATHSPIMINENNIHNVYRFSRKNNQTVIVNPSSKITNDESDLIHMLKIENLSKIFFVNKIIMVEGETDSYFFDHYIQYLKKDDVRANKIGDYEILNINGKGSYRRRKKFLAKFGIDCFFIGDLDNIVDNKILTEGQVTYYRKQVFNYVKNLRSGFIKDREKDKNHKNIIKTKYGIIVEMLKNIYPREYYYLLEQIEILYSQNVFILKRGDLETYIGTKSKSLNDTISFCNKNFGNWLDDVFFDEYRKELNDIFDIIYK